MRQGRDQVLQGRDHVHQGRNEGASVCAKGETMCAKGETFCAKDAAKVRACSPEARPPLYGRVAAVPGIRAPALAGPGRVWPGLAGPGRRPWALAAGPGQNFKITQIYSNFPISLRQ